MLPWLVSLAFATTPASPPSPPPAYEPVSPEVDRGPNTAPMVIGAGLFGGAYVGTIVGTKVANERGSASPFVFVPVFNSFSYVHINVMGGGSKGASERDVIALLDVSAQIVGLAVFFYGATTSVPRTRTPSITPVPVIDRDVAGAAVVGRF